MIDSTRSPGGNYRGSEPRRALPWAEVYHTGKEPKMLIFPGLLFRLLLLRASVVFSCQRFLPQRQENTEVAQRRQIVFLFSCEHDARTQAPGAGVVLTYCDYLFISVIHRHSLSVGPPGFSNSHLASVVGPPHVFAA